MILHINHVADWRYIRQHKQMHINNDVTHENTTIINHSYKVGDKILIKNRSSYKYKTPFIGPNEKIKRGQKVTSPYGQERLHIR